MVKIDSIVTKGGDKGKTSLGDGTRVYKSNNRIVAIGTVDEVNAHIGLTIIEVANPNIKELLFNIQNDLFDLGADLCIPKIEGGKLKITDNHVTYLEKNVEIYNKELKPLTSFVLPGGEKASALLHITRTVTRRAESTIVKLSEEESINLTIVQYLNRLSDLLFILARYVNDCGNKDILWRPGKNG